jgi:hypothetical protein
VGDGSGSDDLHVFEAGAAEGYAVSVSADGIDFTDVGTRFGSAGIDLDAFGFGPDSGLRFVRLLDDGDSGEAPGPTGADIDAIGAISTAPTHALTIEKVADVPGVYDFDVRRGGQPLAELSVTAGATGSVLSGLAPGTITIAEAVPAGQRLDSVLCAADGGEAVDVSTDGAEATLELTASTRCTFVNVSTTDPGADGGRDARSASSDAASAAAVQPNYTG